MPSKEFWRPRLCGARFDDGEIPLQVLSDLTALREMVIDVAKWCYLLENPSRQRVPQGFADKIDLKLAGIDDGSVIPIINIATTELTLPGMEFPHRKFLDLAKDYIATAIATASENGHVPVDGSLPDRFLAHFNRIGRSLRDGEFLELPRSDNLPPAQLTKEVRQRLLQRSAVVEFTQEVTLRGTVPEVDQERMTFDLQQVHGGRVAGPMPEQHREAIMEAFGGYRNNVRILVQGIGRYDRRNHLSSLESVEQVNGLDSLDVSMRLDELRAMKDGWLDGDGKAPSHAHLSWLAICFERYFPDDLPLPHIYPTPEGGIEAEWSLDTHSVIFAIHLDTHQGNWLQFSKDDNKEMAQILNLDDINTWQWLARAIRQLTREDVPE